MRSPVEVEETPAEVSETAVQGLVETAVQGPIDDWALLRDVIWPQPAPFPTMTFPTGTNQ